MTTHLSGGLVIVLVSALCSGCAAESEPPAATSEPEATQVMLPETVAGQDGMVWTADGLLAIVSNSESRVVALTSADEWATAELAGVGTYDVQATTAAVVDGEIYVVHPHFADEDPPSFERVTLQ